MRNLLINAIPGFEFPRKDLNDYVIKSATKSADLVEEADFVIGEDENSNAIVEESSFAEELTSEEVNILAILMMVGWTQR